MSNERDGLAAWKKVLMSAFAILNLLCVLLSNEPDWSSRWRENTATRIQPQPLYRMRQTEWLVRTYSYLVGLDNYWTLFSYMPRFNHWYSIKAHYADGTDRLLPLPMQSKRTFWEHYFFDFRTAKFYLNIYRSEDGRRRYARELCRLYPEFNGSPVQSINIDLYHQNILDRKEALRQGRTMEPQSYHQPYGQVSCLESR